MNYRKICIEDSNTIYRWANDANTRKNSFNSKSISLKDHQKWMESRLVNPNAFYLLCEKGESKIAFIRFDIKNNFTTIGINLNPEYRGRGLASNILVESIRLYFRVDKREIRAFIKKQNKASVKSFENAGFNKFGETVINGIDAWIYKLEYQNEG